MPAEPSSPLPGDVAAVVLAAGAGTRLRPLTDLLPKALCPVGGVPVVDLALNRVAALLGRPVAPTSVAVNAHHLRTLLAAHVAGRVHLSVEEPVALGTAGALGRLRSWVDGRAVLTTNADGWTSADPTGLLRGWDGTTIRLVVVADRVRPDFDGRWRYAGTAAMPWSDVRRLGSVPSGLYEVSWRAARAAGRVELVEVGGEFVDCGTPSDYLRANLLASGGASVIGAGARVDGVVERCVVWPGAAVEAGEHLVECVRAAGPDGPVTVPAPQG